MRSEGQDWAIGQLEDVADASGGTFEVLEIVDAASQGQDVTVRLSVDCHGIVRKAGGISLRVREVIRLGIPWNFPFSIPRAHFSHLRHAGSPHVQWGDYICLYQAPEVEWQASAGMFGFMRRLHDWLVAAAAGELDPAGAPLHPPVAYAVGYFCVVPRQDTPVPPEPFWSGYAEVTSDDGVVAELGRWIERTEEVPDGRLAAAILLPDEMPHEYPVTMLDLLGALVARGVPLEVTRLLMTIGVLRTPPGERALFVLGAAMRGIAGERRLQHIASWRIDADRTDSLREAALKASVDDPVDVREFYGWALHAEVEWCLVLEARPEIVERRDSRSAASLWRGKEVAILGCGAIGSALATMLARAGVARLILVDKGIVTPGILVRQGFRHDHVGRTKVSAVKVNVSMANPAVEVRAEYRNILSFVADEERLAAMLAADAIIDATASSSVSAALESLFRKRPERRPPIVAMALGHNADHGMMTLAVPGSAGVSADLDRRSKLEFARSGKLHPFLEEFWPSDPGRRKPFQPEPGCSSPTFRGSYADVLGLTARMFNVASSWLADENPGSRTFAVDVSAGRSASRAPREVQLSWRPYELLEDVRNGYEVRITREALGSILAWTRESERVNGDRVETGGVLYGQVDEFLRVVWIDEISGPPPDSAAAPDGFVCGTYGVRERHEETMARTAGSVGFVGMWHTHPRGMPVPSETDLGAMRQLLGTRESFKGRRFLMVIVGGTSRHPVLSADLFARSDYAGSLS